MSYKLILLRHGQSEWNLQNRFTGWHDVDLTDKGREEARRAGAQLKAANLNIDTVFTSVLTRAIRTMWIALDEMGLMYLPVERSFRLNERHYGALQGLNKAETAEKHGEEQVKIWRRSFDTPPPALEEGDERLPENDPRYAKLDRALLPRAESLKLTIERVLPYWQDRIVPALREGKTPLVVAHGNSLRALVKYLDDMSDADILEFNIPTGVPIVYELDDNLRPIKREFLGSPEEVAKLMEAVANQGKKD
ncbi:2,3-diphosphoglycerate-dependent phosphoglycerate mutase [Suttonella sp. R2A3]|uniref:2,3-diphosphoglycerate-dependent phosphoglycerate mutase n=1 Tax=Suttonella sp. R2A3 TaxID=2908648 RepID=UPI001F210986|nr:2,3-diphosphoglycerate-dependent phosphoglycerate mutase [Suttonella sp. R2A3]UJF24380.1 2,3-diphosphoglycerate-dependent phosphoglycerate mutase [Suttonella sp. R2A3]